MAFHKSKSEIWVKLEGWGKIVNFSIFWSKSAAMATILAGINSEDQKMGVAMDI